ncbi:50S ribosomal protein L3 [Candidatus Woesebacteria bacterium]|nr:50S ribosomal protein L3 [Candidatus Woesebacteria bacterium]
MAGFILGQKHNQSQTYDEAGNLIPVTVINTAPCYLMDVKTPETSGYFAVKLAAGNVRNIAKPVKGQLKKAGIEAPLPFLKEIRIYSDAKEIVAIEEEGKKGVQIGDQKIFIGEQVKPSAIFKIGDVVDVSGTSRGKGFQGVVKRHGFRGGPKTHGQSDRHRAPGSIGSGTTPGRVYKGSRMAGQTGNVRKTILKLKVIATDETTLTVKGLIPGYKTGYVEVKTHGI